MLDDLTHETLTKVLIPEMNKFTEHVRKIENIIDLENDDVVLPARSTHEHRKIAKYAKTPWASNLISARVNRLKTSGITGPEGSDSEAWSRWKSWGMPRKEKLVYKDGSAFGVGYLEMKKSVSGKIDVVVKDPRRFAAFFGAGEFNDGLLEEFPQMAMEKSLDGTKYRVWDSTNISEWVRSEGGDWKKESTKPHGFPVVPIVRYLNDLDSNGNSVGDIYPVRWLIGRITKTTYDSLMINHSNSWKVKFIAGLSDVSKLPRIDGESDEEYFSRLGKVEEQMRLELDTSTILTSTDPNAKFGTLAETQPSQYVAVLEQMMKELGAVTHTPSEYLTGDVVSQSAEQSSNSQANYRAMINDKRDAYTEGHNSLMRLYLLGTGQDADKWTSSFRWVENDHGAIGSIVDAAVKMVSIGVPKKAIWATLPNTSPEILDGWAEMAEEEKMAEMRAMQASMSMGAALPDEINKDMMDEMELEENG